MERIGKIFYHMNHITSRIYKDGKDFQIIIDLIARIRPSNHLNDYPVKVDIEENLASAEIRANTRLWFDEGLPVGWAFVDEFNNLRWEIDGQYGERIGAEIVAWGESASERNLQTTGKQLPWMQVAGKITPKEFPF